MKVRVLLSPLFRFYPLFHGWQQNGCSELSRRARTAEIDHLLICSLWFRVTAKATHMSGPPYWASGKFPLPPGPNPPWGPPPKLPYPRPSPGWRPPPLPSVGSSSNVLLPPPPLSSTVTHSSKQGWIIVYVIFFNQFHFWGDEVFVDTHAMTEDSGWWNRRFGRRSSLRSGEWSVKYSVRWSHLGDMNGIMNDMTVFAWPLAKTTPTIIFLLGLCCWRWMCGTEVYKGRAPC